VLYRIVAGKSLRLLSGARVDGDQAKFAAYMAASMNWQVIRFVPTTAKRIITGGVLHTG
jgi:hypothetical protein